MQTGKAMKAETREGWLRLFFAVAACSWVPHWSCHYYRLETGSSFVVGNWDFSPLDSVASLIIYGVIIGLNLSAVVTLPIRRAAALLSGVLHLIIGSLHLFRLIHPFRFEVFGHPWSQSASFREALLVIPFGVLCLIIARRK